MDNYLELSLAGVGLATSDDVGSAHGDFFCPPAALGVSVTLPVPLALCMYLQILLSTAAHVGAECRAFTSADQGLQHFIYGSTQMLATQVSR